MFPRKLSALLAISAVVVFAAPASAEGTISIDAFDPSTGAVNGTVVFPSADGPQSVEGFKAVGALNEDTGQSSGLDLVDATIEPLADGSGLRFTWVLSEMPPQVPPEGVRYTWAFAIGENEYQLQAKRTNIASATTLEDPVGHATHLASGREFFQLRGACTVEYLGTPISGCYHLAFLDGSIDVETKTVSMDVPFRTRDSLGRLVAEDFVPGAVVEALETAGMSIAASYQAFVSNTLVSTYLNGWEPYFIGGQVHVGVGPAGTPPMFIDYRTQANVEGSTFEAVAGPIQAGQQLFARACNGVRCVYAAA